MSPFPQGELPAISLPPPTAVEFIYVSLITVFLQLCLGRDQVGLVLFCVLGLREGPEGRRRDWGACGMAEVVREHTLSEGLTSHQALPELLVPFLCLFCFCLPAPWSLNSLSCPLVFEKRRDKRRRDVPVGLRTCFLLTAIGLLRVASPRAGHASGRSGAVRSPRRVAGTVAMVSLAGWLIQPKPAGSPDARLDVWTSGSDPCPHGSCHFAPRTVRFHC